ncbi:MAG: AI-2E family transporter [Clostridia bacterium]|nr:AI-2E family transporter [Clostridia bacterium]
MVKNAKPYLPDGRFRKIWLLLLIPAAGMVLWYRPLLRLLFQVLLSVLLALCALPLAKLYEKRFPRGLSCLMSLLSLLLILSGLIALLIPPILKQMRTAAELIPTILTWCENMLTKIANNSILDRLGIPISDTVNAEKLLRSGAEKLTGVLPALIRGIRSAADKLSSAFIAPVLGYYFLRDREMFSYQASLLIPLRHRTSMLEAVQDMRRETGAYLRSQVLVALCVGGLTAAGLALAGVPAWLVLGLLMGVCEIIPYIGPIIGGIPVVLFGMSKGMGTMLWALLITLIVQQLEGMVIAPRMMAGATGLHPVHVLLLLTLGSMLFGIWGLLFSIPVFICLRAALRTLLPGAV